MNIETPVKNPCFRCGGDGSYFVSEDGLQANPSAVKKVCEMCNGIKNEAGQMPAYESIWHSSPNRIDKLEQENSILADGILDQEKERLKLLERIEKLEQTKFCNDSFAFAFNDTVFKILERIDKLESKNDWLENNWDKVRQVISENDNHCGAITFLERKVEKLEQNEKGIISALENYREYRTRIEDLETDVMYLKEKIDKIENEENDLETGFDQLLIQKDLVQRVQKLEEHHTRQIDENRKIFNRNKLQDEITIGIDRRLNERDEHFDDRLNKLEILKDRKEEFHIRNFDDRISDLEKHIKPFESPEIFKRIEQLEGKARIWVACPELTERVEKLESYFAHSDQEYEIKVLESPEVDTDKAKLLEFVEWCTDHVDLNVCTKARHLLLAIEGY